MNNREKAAKLKEFMGADFDINVRQVSKALHNYGKLHILLNDLQQQISTVTDDEIKEQAKRKVSAAYSILGLENKG